MRGRPEVIDSRGCSRLFVGTSSSLPSFLRFEPISPASSIVSQSPVVIPSTRPFAGLVICVTGLSKGILFNTKYFHCKFLEFNTL